MTPEAITWIRQSHRHMAKWRMAAILGVPEDDVQAVIDGKAPASPRGKPAAAARKKAG